MASEGEMMNSFIWGSAHRMIMNVNPAHQSNVSVQSPLHLGSNGITGHDREQSVNANRNIDDQVWAKPVDLDPHDLFYPTSNELASRRRTQPWWP